MLETPESHIRYSMVLKYRRVRTHEKNMDWEISSEAANSGTFNDYPGSGSTPKRVGAESPKPRKWHGEDIVYTLLKGRGHFMSGRFSEPELCKEWRCG